MAERFVKDGYGTRFAGSVAGTQDKDDGITVQHIYGLEPHTCAEGHTHQDAGDVALHVQDADGDSATIYLNDTEALRLAFLLQRVVGWIANADSEAPDVEREASRFVVPDTAEDA